MRFPRLLPWSLPWLLLAACGGGGAGGPPNGTSTCFYSPTGQVLTLSAAEIAKVNASLLADNEAVVGLVMAGSGVRMTIEFAAPGTLAANEALISNDTEPGVQRDKGVQPKNVCTGIRASIYKVANAPGAVSLKIAKGFGSSGYDTVEFHRPDLFGIWSEIGEFSPDTFWALVAGRNVTFTWITD